MDGGRLRSVLRGIRKAANASDSGGLTDADLLRCWVANRDEAAFEALLWRHFAAVLGVCWRVLRDTHEAEDAVAGNIRSASDRGAHPLKSAKSLP